LAASGWTITSVRRQTTHSAPVENDEGRIIYREGADYDFVLERTDA